MDAKVRAALSLAKFIRPGWRANAVAKPLMAALKAVAPRRAVAEKNMEIVFPGISASEKKKLLNESYENMVWTALEVFGWQRDPSLINEWTVEIAGREYVRRALKLGRGAIAVTGHNGNWEHIVAWGGYNFDAAVIVRNADSPFQRDFINATRESSGVEIIGKEKPMLRVVSALKKNRVVGIASDQYGGGEGIPAPFFGVRTQSAQGAAVFSYLTGAPIIPIQSIRLAPFRLRIEISPQIEWEKKKDRRETISSITALVNKALERMVLRAPGQWLWEHRRFREIGY